MTVHSLDYGDGIRAYLVPGRWWYIYQDNIFGYYVPNYLGLVTQDKAAVRRYIRTYLQRVRK